MSVRPKTKNKNILSRKFQSVKGRGEAVEQQLSTYKFWSFDSLTSPIMFIVPVAV